MRKIRLGKNRSYDKINWKKTSPAMMFIEINYRWFCQVYLEPSLCSALDTMCSTDDVQAKDLLLF